MSEIPRRADAASSRAPLRIVMGPTAAGKSAIAMHLAEHFGLAIISADSRQVYRGFDIGTAKPTADEQRRVPHYGVDVLNPMDRYSAHQWAADAMDWLDAARATGRDSVIVGGTGFYVRALVHPLDPVPALEPHRRHALEEWMQRLTSEELVRWCQRLDPARAALGPVQQRRAIETALLAGRRLSDALAQPSEAPPAPLRPVRYLVVDPGPILATRIAERVQSMVRAGWIDEITRLIASVPPDAPAWKASGYRTLRDAVVSRAPLEPAIERVIIETRQYAKRQRTWCRHQLPTAQVQLLDSTAGDALASARRWWAFDEGSEA